MKAHMRKAQVRLVVPIALVALLLSVTSTCLSKAREAAGLSAREAAAEIVEFPFQLVSDHIVLSAIINGSGEIDMLLDTGMPMRGAILLDPALAEGIDLEYMGTVDLGGGGSDVPKTADVASGATISIAGSEFTGQRVMVLREGAFADDWPVAAIIGKTIFERVAEIDFANSIIRLYGSIEDMPGEPGERFDMGFTMGIPVIDAVVKDGSGRPLPVSLIADTGVNDSFLLFTYSDEDLRLPEKTLRCKDGVLGEGLTGDMLGSLGRTPELELGPFTLTEVITGYPDESTMGHAGALAQNGFLGTGIMKRFNVIFDYSQEALYLKPNPGYRRPFEWNMAGLLVWINRDGFLQVKDVVEASPGWDSGIRAGDVITSVDGINIRDMDNAEVFDAFSRDGAEVSLSILSEAGPRTVSVKLRRLI